MKSLLPKNEKGSALVLTMMVLLVLSVLGVAVLSVSVANLKTGLVEREFQSSYYISEAGAVYYMQDIKADVVSSTATTADQFFSAVESGRVLHTVSLDSGFFEEEYGSTPKAEVTLKRINMTETNPRTYEMVSKGIIDNFSRTVVKTFAIEWSESIDLSNLMTVFSLEQMTINNGTIVGPIGTNYIASNAINITGWPTIQDYYLRTGSAINASEWWNNKGNKLNLTEVRNYPLPAFPSFPQVSDCTPQPSIYRSGGVAPYTVNLTSDYVYIPRIDIYSDRILNIDLNGGDRKLLIDDINVDQGKIIILGSGSLEIYLKNNIVMGGGSIINDPASESISDIEAAVNKVDIYVKGTDSDSTYKNITLAGSQKIYGSLFAEDANIDMKAGTGFQGSIVTGGISLNINGGTSIISQMIYAPNTNVSLTHGGKVNGPIISKTFYMDGGAKVQYDPINSPIPIDALPGGAGGPQIRTESAIREK